MARVLTTGAEEIYMPGLWDNIFTSSLTNLVMTNGYARTAGNYVDPRTGYACYGLRHSDGLWKSLANVQELYGGVALYATNTPQTWRAVQTIDASNGGIGIWFTNDGKIHAAQEGNGNIIASSVNSVFTVGTWHYIEFYMKIATTGGRVIVKIDGTQIIDYTGNTAWYTQYVTLIRFVGYNGNGLVAFDDIVVNDTSGTTNNSWPGQVRLMPILPTSAGSSAQLTRAGVDLGSNFANSRSFGQEFSLLQTTAVNNKDLYAMEVPDLPENATITNVIASARVRVENGSGNAALLIKANGTESQGGDVGLTSGWKTIQLCLSADPSDNAAWTEADLASLQMGVKAR